MSEDGDAFSVKALVTTGNGLLALALLATELMAGMQQFLTATVTPLLAKDLGGQHLYGVAAAAPQVAIFLTMPLGGELMRRFSPAALMAWLTPVTILAGIAGALSPTMEFYIGTRVVAGLAAGVLATVGMGAIVTGLPPAWRQLVLAANNLMWLFSAVVGPMYAAWAAQVLSWRWALVLYLPFLFAARMVIARQLGKQPKSEAEKAKLPLVGAVVLAAGIALTTSMSAHHWWAQVAGVAGLVLVLGSLPRLIPSGILSLRPGGRSALALLGVLAPMLFAADAIVAICGHDVLGFSPFKLGLLLTSSSFFWSLVGLFCGKWPVTGRAFRVRGGLGVLLLAAGLLILAAALWARAGWWFITGFAVCGTGMGLVFLDAMNVAFADEPDQLDPALAASASVLLEQVPGAAAMTVSTSLMALQPSLGGWIFAALSLLAFPAWAALWRATTPAASA